jgi:hypothetical protein
MVTNSHCLELQLCDEDLQKVMSCGTHDDEVASVAGVKCICRTDVIVAKDGCIACPIFVTYMRMVVLRLGAPTLKINPM